MVITISKKLMLAFLGLTLVVLIATLGLARWSFERGFLDYVNALEQGRLERLAASLSREYTAAGSSWSLLTERDFDRLVHGSAPWMPDIEQPGRRRSPPGEPGRPHQGPAPGMPPAPPGSTHPTALFDLTGRQIGGSILPAAEEDPISIPVLVEDETVGYIKSVPRRRFDTPQETAFSRQQLLTSGLIAIVALALATGVSLFLTRVLLAPIRRMLLGVSELTTGNYAYRLRERRQDELGQLMAGLDRLADKLEQSRDSRQRWLADISHELRTPVTVLTGEIETLKDGIRPLDMQCILSLDQEVARLRHLIGDLYDLSLSDIGGLRYTFSPVDVSELLSSIVDNTAQAEEPGITVSLAADARIVVNADRQRLHQLFSNLMQNSLAYTDSPGELRISMSKDRDKVIIQWQDTLPGISAGESERLFEPLYRHDASRSRRTAGAGLGLAICRNIVNAHLGSISASPSVLGGLCITIEFPAWKQP